MDNVIDIRRNAPRLPRQRGFRLAPANYTVRGSMREVLAALPVFERRQFGQGFAALGTAAHANPRLHAIVEAHSGLPVGVVSPDYALIQHADALAAVAAGLAAHGVVAGASMVTAELSAQGEHMVATCTLPGLPAYIPRDGYAVAPVVMLGNSVDGKSALRANFGWFRAICANGLIIPYAASGLKRRHANGLSVADIAATVDRELGRVLAERDRLAAMDRALIDGPRLAAWVDGAVRERWGAQAATRVFHIVLRGMDITLSDPFEQATPSQRTVDDFGEVPGSVFDRPTAYSALQALTWVASRSENLNQRWEREADALELTTRLAAAA
jgi:hypothetical protein